MSRPGDASVNPNFSEQPGIVFVYGARETVWPGIASFLQSEDSTVRESLERSDAIIRSYLGWSLLTDAFAPNRPIREFMLEPVNTAIQIALTAAWRRRGVQPDAVLSRCGGEFAAGYASGALEVEDALDLACRVGKLIQQGRGRGKMLFVRLPFSEAEKIREASPLQFEVISDGHDNYSVIACEVSSVKPIIDLFRTCGCHVGALQSSFALHSWMMESWQDEMLRPLQGRTSMSGIPIYSATSRGRLPPDVQWTSHSWRVVREPVVINSAIRAVLDEGFRHFLEVGGHPSLRDIIVRRASDSGLQVSSLATMERLRRLREVMDGSHAALLKARQF